MRRARRRRPLWLSVLFGLITVAVALGALGAGYIFYDTLRTLVASAMLPGAPSAPAGPNVSGNNAPGSILQWERKERLNFLLLGIDLRRGETGAARSDTMIVVTLDPQNKKVGLLSIPRDLWVPIPGYGENRINVANYLGDARKYPGGGAALAKKTVQYNLGVPIHYYIRINFDGFRRLVDTLGGITLDVPKEINDPTYPDEAYGYKPIHIRAGRQRMDGETALQYARTRHADDDFQRAKRQIQVLLAIRDQAMSIDIIPKIPALWAMRENMVATDLTLDDILSLAQLARDIKAEDVKSVIIDETMTVAYVTDTGAQVLWPDREKIRKVVEELFAPPAPAQVPSPTSETQRLIVQEAARIEVQNGTKTPGLAEKAASYLRLQGYQVLAPTNADRSDYAQTVIIVYNNGVETTLKTLTETLPVAPGNVRRSSNVKSSVDIRIILGKDFKLPSASTLP